MTMQIDQGDLRAQGEELLNAAPLNLDTMESTGAADLETVETTGELKDEGLTALQFAVEKDQPIELWYVPTGKKLTVLGSLAAETLRFRDDFGNPLYSLEPILYDRPIWRCKLHPDEEMRAQWTAMGLPVCRKATLANPQQVRLHLMTVHPMAYRTIMEYMADERDKRAEEREEQTNELMRELLVHRGSQDDNPQLAALIESIQMLTQGKREVPAHEHKFAADVEGAFCVIERDCDVKHPGPKTKGK